METLTPNPPKFESIKRRLLEKSLAEVGPGSSVTRRNILRETIREIDLGNIMSESNNERRRVLLEHVDMSTQDGESLSIIARKLGVKESLYLLDVRLHIHEVLQLSPESVDVEEVRTLVSTYQELAELQVDASPIQDRSTLNIGKNILSAKLYLEMSMAENNLKETFKEMAWDLLDSAITELQMNTQIDEMKYDEIRNTLESHPISLLHIIEKICFEVIGSEFVDILLESTVENPQVTEYDLAFDIFEAGLDQSEEDATLDDILTIGLIAIAGPLGLL